MFFDRSRFFEYITKKFVRSAAIMGLMIAPMFSGFSENIDLSQPKNDSAPTTIQALLESSAPLRANPEIQNPRLTEIAGEFIQKNWKKLALATATDKAKDYGLSLLTDPAINMAKNYADSSNISKNIYSAANATTEYIKDYISYASSSGVATAKGYGTFLQAGLFAAKGLVSSHPIASGLIGGFVIIETAKAAIKYYPYVKNKISSLFNQKVETVAINLKNPEVLTNKVIEALGENNNLDFKQKLEKAISEADDNYLEIITHTLAIDNPSTVKNILTPLISSLMEKSIDNKPQ